jgi:hypothetical protein
MLVSCLFNPMCIFVHRHPSGILLGRVQHIYIHRKLSLFKKLKNLKSAILYQVRSGMVTVNNVVISDPRVSFGGVKKSGFGRELSRYGMLEFVDIKSIRFYDELVHQHHVE